MREFIEKISKLEHLTYKEMVEVSKLIFNEKTESQQIIDFLVALSQKGETSQEVAGTCYSDEVICTGFAST